MNWILSLTKGDSRGAAMVEVALLLLLVSFLAVPALRLAGIRVGDVFCAASSVANDTDASGQVSAQAHLYFTMRGWECRYCDGAESGSFCEDDGGGY